MLNVKCPISGKDVELVRAGGEGRVFVRSQKGGWFSRVFESPAEAEAWLSGFDMAEQVLTAKTVASKDKTSLHSAYGWQTEPAAAGVTEMFATLLKKTASKPTTKPAAKKAVKKAVKKAPEKEPTSSDD